MPNLLTPLAASAPAAGAPLTQIIIGTVFAGSIRYFTDPTSIGSGVGAVTSGPSKNLKLDPGSHNVTLNLLIAGCTAVS